MRLASSASHPSPPFCVALRTGPSHSRSRSLATTPTISPAEDTSIDQSSIESHSSAATLAPLTQPPTWIFPDVPAVSEKPCQSSARKALPIGLGITFEKESTSAFAPIPININHNDRQYVFYYSNKACRAHHVCRLFFGFSSTSSVLSSDLYNQPLKHEQYSPSRAYIPPMPSPTYRTYHATSGSPARIIYQTTANPDNSWVWYGKTPRPSMYVPEPSPGRRGSFPSTLSNALGDGTEYFIKTYVGNPPSPPRVPPVWRAPLQGRSLADDPYPLSTLWNQEAYYHVPSTPRFSPTLGSPHYSEALRRWTAPSETENALVLTKANEFSMVHNDSPKGKTKRPTLEEANCNAGRRRQRTSTKRQRVPTAQGPYAYTPLSRPNTSAPYTIKNKHAASTTANQVTTTTEHEMHGRMTSRDHPQWSLDDKHAHLRGHGSHHHDASATITYPLWNGGHPLHAPPNYHALLPYGHVPMLHHPLTHHNDMPYHFRHGHPPHDQPFGNMSATPIQASNFATGYTGPEHAHGVPNMAHPFPERIEQGPPLQLFDVRTGLPAMSFPLQRYAPPIAMTTNPSDGTGRFELSHSRTAEDLEHVAHANMSPRDRGYACLLCNSVFVCATDLENHYASHATKKSASSPATPLENKNRKRTRTGDRTDDDESERRSFISFPQSTIFDVLSYQDSHGFADGIDVPPFPPTKRARTRSNPGLHPHSMTGNGGVLSAVDGNTPISSYQESQFVTVCLFAMPSARN